MPECIRHLNRLLCKIVERKRMEPAEVERARMKQLLEGALFSDPD